MLSLFRARGARTAVAGLSASALAAGAVVAAATTAGADSTATPSGAACAAPQVTYLTEANTGSAYDEWTLSSGSTTEFTAEGLAIDSTGQIAYMNYGIERFDVADAGTTAFDYERTSGDYDISLSLAYAEDSSVNWSGTLVYEPGVYGEGNWWSTKDNKAGNWHLFTLEEFAAEFPEADVIGVGFSLGSTSVGTGVVSSVTAGCTEYRFADSASVPRGPELPSTLIDFEQATDAGSAEGGVAGVTIVPAGDDMAAAAGCFYAEAPVTNYGTHQLNGFVNTYYGGRSSEFPAGGYTASADFYLAADAEAGQFSWSHAVNGTDGAHQRDFVFHATSDGAGSWEIGASNGATTTAPYVSTSAVETVTISQAGWYTFQHTIREQDGLLYVDLAVIDAAGTELAEWTLGGVAGDQVPFEVGGNRYGWLVNNAFDALPIDNVLLNAERPTNACDDGATDGGDTDGNTDGGDTDGNTDGSTDGGTDGGTTEGSPVTETVVFEGQTDAEVTVSGIKAPGARALVAETSFTANPSDLGAIPANVSMPFGAFGVTLAVEEGSSATIAIDLPSPVNSLYKHLGDGWVEYPATFSGTTVEFVVTDGGAGDADGEANGVIVDPAAPALTATFTG